MKHFPIWQWICWCCCCGCIHHQSFYLHIDCGECKFVHNNPFWFNTTFVSPHPPTILLWSLLFASTLSLYPTDVERRRKTRGKRKSVSVYWLFFRSTFPCSLLLICCFFCVCITMYNSCSMFFRLFFFYFLPFSQSNSIIKPKEFQDAYIANSCG